MKNYRSEDQNKGKELNKNNKAFSLEQKTYSPTTHSLKDRLIEYQTLAKKAKQQLKNIQARKKNSPQPHRYTTLVQQNNENQEKLKGSHSVKSAEYTKNLLGTYSQKYFKKQNNLMQIKTQPKDLKNLSKRKEEPRNNEKNSADKIILSPKKKPQIDGNQYKKLHEKLDSIENKISDMKKNLQKKKDEKQRIMESAHKHKNLHQKQSSQKKMALKGLVTQMPQLEQLHIFHSNPYSPRNSTYYVSQLIRAYKDERSLARQHLVTSLSILKLLQKSKKMSQEDAKILRSNLPYRKGYEGKKTLIFDLDQTLIHCKDTLIPPYDVKLPITFSTGEVIQAGINIRPYARQILRNLSKHFQIIVFTASHSCYANVVIDHLDPNNQWIHHRLFRDQCFLSAQGLYIKDLRKINRDLKDIILVDNAAYSYAYQLSNGIPILPYYHGQVDFELRMLEQYLMKLPYCRDVRQINQKTFKLHQYKHYYNKPQKLVEELYIGK